MKISRGFDRDELLTFSVTRHYLSLAFLGVWMTVWYIRG